MEPQAPTSSRGALGLSLSPPPGQPRSWTCNIYLVRSSYPKEGKERRVFKSAAIKSVPITSKLARAGEKNDTKYQIPNTADRKETLLARLLFGFSDLRPR